MNKVVYLLDKIKAWHILFLLAVYFLLYNMYFPLFADDYTYANIFHDGFAGNLEGVRVQSFHDIFISMYNHYFTWGGRITAHVFVQFFVWQGKMAFNIANTIVFVFSLLLIYWLSFGQISIKKLSAKYILAIFICIWLVNPSFAVTDIWLTGTCNYRWMSVLQLLFLFPFVQTYLAVPQQIPIKVLYFIMPLISFFAGWSNENSGLVIIAMGAFFLYCLYKEKRAKHWLVLNFAACVIGWAVLVAAPGNYARLLLKLQTMTMQQNIEVLGLWLAYMLPVYLIMLYFFMKSDNKVLFKNKLYTCSILFAVMALANVVIMIFSPYFPPRAGFNSSNLICIAALFAYRSYQQNSRQSVKKLLQTIAVVLILLTGISMFGTLLQVRHMHKQVVQRYGLMAGRQGQSITVPKYYLLPRWTRISLGKGVPQWAIKDYDLKADTMYFSNRRFAHYYGLKSIRVPQ